MRVLIVRFWNWGVKHFIPYAIPGTIILALAKAGALLQNNLFIYAMIVGICVIVGLVAFNKLGEKYYPHIIGAIGFALLIQTTLIGPGLIGSDVHGEYYFYNEAINNGWDFNYPHPYNASIGTTVIAPFLTNVFRIPGYWIYKVIFPFMFAFVPFILYFVFRKEFGSKTALFAVLFFVIVPTWSMEMIALPRQMLGELMLVLCIYLVVVSKWRYRVRVPLLVVLGVLGAMFHYVMGPMIFFYLGLGCLFLVFFKRRVFPVKWLALSALLISVMGAAYYGTVAGGMPLESITGISEGYAKNIMLGETALKPKIHIADDGSVIVRLQMGEEDVDYGDDVEVEILEVEDEGNGIKLPRFITDISPLMRTAWGLDFMDVDIWGKLFRVFQYLTQLAIIIGVIRLIWTRKRYSAEYLSLCGASLVLLGACLFIPRFASLINATRMYHLVLIVLAPVFILGGMTIFRNYKLLTVGLIIPYFLFTSGFIFEATQQTDISKVNMPYSISLSDHRVDMAAVFTDNDLDVLNWANDNIDGWVYADTHNILFFSEVRYLKPYWYLVRALRTGDFSGGKHIFLSEKNNRGNFVTWRPEEWEQGFCREPTSGLRVSMSYEEVGLDKIIEEGEIIYRQGDAFIVEVRDVSD